MPLYDRWARCVRVDGWMGVVGSCGAELSAAAGVCAGLPAAACVVLCDDVVASVSSLHTATQTPARTPITPHTRRTPITNAAAAASASRRGRRSRAAC